MRKVKVVKSERMAIELYWVFWVSWLERRAMQVVTSVKTSIQFTAEAR